MVKTNYDCLYVAHVYYVGVNLFEDYQKLIASTDKRDSVREKPIWQQTFE